MNTNELIASLSTEAARKSLATPKHYAIRLMLALGLYAMSVQIFLGFRNDLTMQLARPMFLMEIILLALLTITSAVAAVLSMYPDRFQKQAVLKAPYGVFCVLVIFVLSQLGMPDNEIMAIPDSVDVHDMECALCIAFVAMIPAAIIFALLRKGASVHPFNSGSLAVVAASGIGCLTIRLAEANDSISHLISWHYTPTLLFAMLGAFVGKWLLRW